MRLKIIFGILFLLVIVGTVSAATDTPVTINTIPYYDLIVRFLNPGTNNLIGETVYTSSNASGQVSFSFSTTKEEFEMKVWLKKDGDTVLTKLYDETFLLGNPIDVELYPSWYEVPKKEEPNETIEINTTIEENVTEVSGTTASEEETIPEEKVVKDKQEKITAKASEGGITINSKIAYYIGAGVLLILIIFFSYERLKRKKSPKEIRIKKLSELQEDKEDRIEKQEQRIKDAEKEMEDAKETIKKIRSENKIAEVKKRLIEDEKELMKLRKGDDEDKDEEKVEKPKEE